jgi:hypothetical protein
MLRTNPLSTFQKSVLSAAIEWAKLQAPAKGRNSVMPLHAKNNIRKTVIGGSESKLCFAVILMHIMQRVSAFINSHRDALKKTLR